MRLARDVIRGWAARYIPPRRPWRFCRSGVERGNVSERVDRTKITAGQTVIQHSPPELARTRLLAHLIAAVLTDEIAIAGFSPSAA
jgi:hypothetical protein